jgi:hypothetical protein
MSRTRPGRRERKQQRQQDAGHAAHLFQRQQIEREKARVAPITDFRPASLRGG